MPSIGRLRYIEAQPAAGTRRQGTLLLIHAFPLHAGMWEPQLELSARGWHVVAPELRGMNGGDGNPPAASMDDYAGDIIDLLDALHVDTAVIGGCSMGGYVAFAVFRHASSLFRGLVLADTRSTADTPEGVEARKRMIALVETGGADAVAEQMVPSLLGETSARTKPELADRVRAMIQANPAAAIRSAVTAMMTRPDSTGLLATVHCPVLILVGSEDRLTPPAFSEDMHRAIAGSQLSIIDGVGHLSSLEAPRAFNTALGDFLDRRV